MRGNVCNRMNLSMIINVSPHKKHYFLLKKLFYRRPHLRDLGGGRQPPRPPGGHGRGGAVPLRPGGRLLRGRGQDRALGEERSFGRLLVIVLFLWENLGIFRFFLFCAAAEGYLRGFLTQPGQEISDGVLEGCF